MTMQETGNNIITKKPRLTIRIGKHSLSFSALSAEAAEGITFEPYTVRSGISMAANLREAFKRLTFCTADGKGQWCCSIRP